MHKYSLRAPHERRKYWHFRTMIDGHRGQFSTGCTDEESAREFVRRFFEAMDADTEEARREVPREVPLGEFEAWLLATYRLDGEYVLDAGGQPLRFYANKDGYLEVKLRFRHWYKKMLEHRLKFLLRHGWLPATVDHKNRVRRDNRLDNLQASTPALQRANAHPRGGGIGRFVGTEAGAAPPNSLIFQKPALR